MNKDFLRKKYLNIRLEADLFALNNQSIAISKNLLNLIKQKFPNKKNIASYFPVNNEVNLVDLYAEFIATNYKIALPKISSTNKLLKFYEFEGEENMVAGKYNIWEPINNKEIIPEIVIIPSIACDKTGTRLGYGGGYYDFTLDRLRINNEIIVIAPCFDFQIVENLPNLQHDHKVDIIVSNKNIILI